MYRGSLDGAALPGAIDAVVELQRRDLPLRFLTNTSKRPRQAVFDELVDLGFSLQAEQLITAPIAVKQLLQQQQQRPFIISTPALLDDFSDIDTDEPKAAAACISTPVRLSKRWNMPPMLRRKSSVNRRRRFLPVSPSQWAATRPTR